MSWPFAKQEQTPEQITREFLSLVRELDGPAEQQRVYQVLASAEFWEDPPPVQEQEREVTEAIKWAFSVRDTFDPARGW